MDATQGTERIDPESDVIGSGGDKLGTVSYVVARPPQMKVTDIVVSTGEILGRDIVVPIDKVQGVENGSVHLSIDKADLQGYDDYVDVNYKTPPMGWIPPAGLYAPPSSMLWPMDTYFPQEASVKVNAPPGTVGVSSGMDVVSSDGHKVGSVDGVYVDPQTDEVTALILKHGFIFTHDAFLPIQYVENIEGGTITLNLTADEVKYRIEGKQSGEPRVTGPAEE